MTTAALGIVAAVVVALFLAGPLGDDGEDGGGNGDGAAAEATTTTVTLPFVPDEGTVYSYASTFLPTEVEAVAGETVVFENADDVAHSFTDDRGRFDSGAVAPGETFGVAYSTPGVHRFHCEIHPRMRGELEIRPLP